MRTKDVAHVEVTVLVQEYADAAATHGNLDLPSKKINQSYDLLVAIYKELRKRNEALALLPLIDHANPSVRRWAASHALEFAPDVGERELRKMAKGPPSPTRLNAEMTLDAWRAGTLKFP